MAGQVAADSARTDDRCREVPSQTQLAGRRHDHGATPRWIDDTKTTSRSRRTCGNDDLERDPIGTGVVVDRARTTRFPRRSSDRSERSDGIQVGLQVTRGALVVDVVPGTPAIRRASRDNGAIVAIDGQRVSSASSLGTVLFDKKPGDVVQVTWTDTSGTHTASATLIEGPAL